MFSCSECGAKVGWLVDMCDSCRQDKIDKAFSNREPPKQDPAIERAQQVVLTTAPVLPDSRVVKTLDIVTAECVFGMNVFRDLFAGLSDLFGGRSEASQKILRDARKTCLNELRREANMIGANAVIAVDLDYSEFSGGGKSMLFLVASGTAVILAPE